jgi:hypothetical protein
MTAFGMEKARLEREIQDSMDETMRSLKELSHNMDHVATMSQGLGSLARPWTLLSQGTEQATHALAAAGGAAPGATA